MATIEGLHDDPLQRAFIEADAFQCGFCEERVVDAASGVVLN